MVVISLILQSQTITAQSFPEIRVFGEDDGSENADCNALHSSAIGAIQASLRNNNVRVSMSTSALELTIYANITATKISPTFCAVQMQMTLRTFQAVTLNVDKTQRFATILFCEKSALVIGRPAHIYSSILTNYTDWTNRCLTEFAGSTE